MCFDTRKDSVQSGNTWQNVQSRLLNLFEAFVHVCYCMIDLFALARTKRMVQFPSLDKVMLRNR